MTVHLCKDNSSSLLYLYSLRVCFKICVSFIKCKVIEKVEENVSLFKEFSNLILVTYKLQELGGK